MTERLAKGTRVHWSWGSGTAHGAIEERYERAVSRTIKGKRIRRKGSAENPAYVIKQEDGDRVLKLGSEVRKG